MGVRFDLRASVLGTGTVLLTAPNFWQGRKRRIVGPVRWGQSLELPRASSRGGVNAKPDCNLSESTTSCQNGIVSQGTNANEAARRLFRSPI
jgi:hypothetical protein